MSDHPEGHTRDNSPSAQSHHSAALEWDPSADIGTQVPANTPVHATRGTGTQLQFDDLSTLEQMVISLSKGYEIKSTKSRTLEKQTETEAGTSNHDSPSDSSNDSSYKTATDEPSPEVTKSNISNSSWQTSGLTKSEIEYRSKRERSGSDQSSSSILWVEVHPEDRSKVSQSTSANISIGKPSSKSVATQDRSDAVDNTQKSRNMTMPKLSKDKKTSMDSRSRSTRKSDVPAGHSGGCHCIHQKQKCRCQGQHHHCHSHGCKLMYVPMEYFCQTGVTVGAGSGGSVSSAPKKHSSKSRDLDTQPSSSSSSLQTCDSSDITPTCELLGKLLNEDDAGVRKYGYEFLEMHRNSLVSKMRKEFHHLERLNKLLLSRRLVQAQDSNGSDANGDSQNPPSSDDQNGASDNVHTDVQVSHTVSWTSNGTGGSANVPKRDERVNENVHKSRTNASHKYMQNIPVGDSQNSLPSFQKPVSYFVPLTSTHVYSAQRTRAHRRSSEEAHNKENENYPSDNNGQYNSNNYVMFENEMIQISLQQAFQQYCPNVVANVQYREQMLQNLKQERKTEAEVKRTYFTNHNCVSPNESLNQALPRKEPRIMSMKQMKNLTEKKLKKLPEVQEKLVRRRKEEEKKTNRLLTQVFSRLENRRSSDS